MRFFTVVEFTDALHHTPSSVEHHAAGYTVAEWLAGTRYGTEIKASPTLLILNGEALLEADFGRVLEEHDVLTVVPIPGIVDWVFYAIVGISVLLGAAGLYLALTAPTPDGIGRNSSTYSIGYRGNQRRPGEPIPVVYGTMRTYPDVTGNYTQYEENGDQWLTQIFDISQGYCDIDEADVFYEDTPLTSFPEREVEILHPGETSKLFPSEVFVSTEVQNLEPPRDKLVFTPAYNVTPPGERSEYIELDFVAPQGIYNMSTSGDLRSDLAQIRVRVIEVDSGGTELAYSDFDYDMGGTKTTQPQRMTVRINASEAGLPGGGLYTVAVARREGLGNNTRYVNMWTWGGMRGFSPDKSPTTTTTRIALRVRQSETLGNASLSKFNVLAKRHLPSWSPGGGWTAPAYTDNAMAAFADILRADYGARLPDNRLDLPALYDLSQRPLAKFNGVFDNEIDVWQALNEVCAPLLARPLELPGGKFSAVVDDEGVVPSAMFTMRNILAGTFNVQHVGVLESDYDSVKVTYNNAEEDYRQTSILCVPFGEPGERQKEVTVRGVTSAEAAYEIGIRQANESKWRRKLIRFETGLEGYLPHFGETLRIHHYLLGLEQSTPAISGEAKSYNSGPGSLTVREDLSPLVGQTGLQVYLRNPDGSPFGPVTCTVPDAETINFTGSIAGWAPEFGAGFAGPLFCVGKSTDFMETVKVLNVSPSEGHRVTIEAVVDNSNVYIKGEVPSYSPIDLPQRIYPIVSNLTWGLYGDPANLRVRLSWTGKYADYYLVQHSLDGGVTWEGLFRTEDLYVTGTPPLMANYMVRVCGVGLMQGAWETLSINTENYTLEPPPMARLRIRDAFLGKALRVAWDQGPSGFVPSFDIYWNGVKKTTYTLPEGTVSGEFNYADAIQIEADTYSGLTLPKEGTRSITIYGYFQNQVGTRSKNAAILTAENPQVQVLPNAGYFERGANLNIYFDMPDDGDFAWCEVYMSQTDGFLPDETTLMGRYTANDINLVNVLEYASTYYLRIAGVDVWGRDNLTYSDQFTVLTSDQTIEGSIDYGNITGAKPPIDATRNQLWFQATPPVGQDGDYWYDSTGGRLHQWVGGAWVAISTNIKTFSRATAPSNPADNLVTGDLWYDSDSLNGDLYRWNGSNWSRVATERASWDNLGDRPSDADILNSLQQWDQILDASGTRPADNATKNELYRQASPPPDAVIGDLWYCTATNDPYQAEVLYRRTAGGWENYGNGFTDTLQLQDGASLGKSADWGFIIGAGKPEDGATKNAFTYGSTPPVSGTNGDLFMDSDTGLMFKWQDGAWRMVASSIQVYYSATQPLSPKDGDIWFDEDVGRNPNRYMFRYNASQGAWVKISSVGADWNSELWGKPTDETLLNIYQKWSQVANDNGQMPDPGATKNVIYRQATIPAGSNGALWYCTADVSTYKAGVLYQYISGSWQRAGNDFTNTGQLVDDAQLGQKADWSFIIGAGKPEDNATLSNIYYSATPPTPVRNNDLWYETDSGFVYKGVNGTWTVVATNSNVYSQPNAPTNPNVNDLWYDSDSANRELKKWDGSAWITVSTLGADWGINLRGQPSDSQIMNALQQWDEILDASGTRPADNATQNRIFYTTGPEPAGSEGDLWYNPDTKIFQRHDGNTWAPVSNDFRATGDLEDDAGLGETADWSKIFGEGKPVDGATKNIFTYASIPPGTGVDGDLFMDADTGIVYMWRNGGWTDVATSTNIYRQDAAPPNPKIGDTWFDTGLDNTRGELRRWDGSQWQVIATDGAVWGGGSESGGIKGQPSDSALLNTLQEWDDVKDTRNAGKPESGATKSRIYYTTNGSPPATPSGGFAINDLWFDKLNNLMTQYTGSSWRRVGNDFTDTTQLSDGAKLGETADWAQIVDPTFAGKPENGATKNSFYYQDSQPTGSFTTGDLWFDSGDGFVSKWNGSAWVPVATSTQVYRAATQPSGAKPGDLWYDTDDASKPLYRLRQTPSSTFSNWDKVATDGALWDQIWDRPEVSEPVGDRGNLFVDGTLDKTAKAGDTNFDRYFSLASGSSGSYVKLYSDATQRAIEMRGYNNSDQGLLDKNLYKVSKDQYLYCSFRAIKVSPTGSDPQLRIGGRVYNKAGTQLGWDYFTLKASNISDSAWQWYHGTFKISRNDSFAIQPFVVNALSTGGYLYVDDLYLGYAPNRVSSSTLPGFMEALTVDTLYIADNAVTIAEFFYDDSIQTFTDVRNPVAVYHTIMSGPVELSGTSPVLFTISIEINMYDSQGAWITQSRGSKYLQLLRGSTVIRRDRIYTHESGENAYIPGTFTLQFTDYGHNGVSENYSVQIGNSHPSTGGGNMVVSIRAVSISKVQVKK